MKHSFSKAAAVAALAARRCSFAAQAWEPTKNVEFIIPAGTGGGADQMARAIQGIVAKHNLMKQSILPINKAGGAGAEGFLDVKGASGDPHKIIITLSNLFTTPLATGGAVQLARPDAGADAGARQLRAVGQRQDALQDAQGVHRGGEEGRPGQDEDGRHRRQAGRPDHHRRDRAEDRHQVHLHPVQGRRRGGDAAGRRPRRLDGQQPDRGGGAVARAATCGRCACSTPSACRTRTKVTDKMSWADIPVCKDAGPRRRLPDAARHLHGAAASSPTRCSTTSTCSRR